MIESHEPPNDASPIPLDMPELPEMGQSEYADDQEEQPNPQPQTPPQPFSGAEVARFVTGAAVFGLGVAGIVKTKAEAQAFATVFNAPTTLIPPQMAAGLEVMTDVSMAGVLDALDVGELLASVGISKRISIGTEAMKYMPSWLRAILAVGVIGAGAMGGIFAARQVGQHQKQQNNPSSGDTGGGDPFEQQY